MEYYLSDKNLEKDAFFREILTREGSLKIETLLNCNKLKALNCTIALIAASVADSTVIELCEDKVSIRRKQPLGDLPVFKKVKTEGQKKLDSLRTINP